MEKQVSDIMVRYLFLEITFCTTKILTKNFIVNLCFVKHQHHKQFLTFGQNLNIEIDKI